MEMGVLQIVCLLNLGGYASLKLQNLTQLGPFSFKIFLMTLYVNQFQNQSKL